MTDKPASEQIDDIIKKLDGWKGRILSELRAVITKADPGMVEEVKWKMASRPEGLAVWYNNGMVCFAEVWKDNIKLIFVKGVHMKDPKNLFNARLKSSTDRAIEFHDGDIVDKSGLKQLVIEAVRLNSSK